MELKTKLRITSITIVAMPILLTTIAFFVISAVLNKGINASIIADNEMYQTIAEEIIETVEEDIEEDDDVLEDTDYLDSLNTILQKSGAYIIVRCGSDVYYMGDEDGYNIFEKLPDYGQSEDISTGIFFNHEKKMIKQYDFSFADGSEGSLFIVFNTESLISPTFLLYMGGAICIIMLFTSIILTMSIKNGVFKPISELNIAMQKIRDGNFDYRLNDNNETGEIGQMYRNYEDMRLRLKESAEEKLEHEQQNKELIRNISHDLKTPITTIRGYAEGLIEGVATTKEKQEKYLRTIYNKANDMNNLINELTLYSSIDNNRIPYNFRKINVGDYFGDCVEEVGMDMEGRGIKLNYSNLTAPDTIIIADPEQLKRVINNIVSNSVKYMDRTDGKGEIDIRILDEVDSIRVEIEDNGRGIAQKDLANIFERFYRTDASRNSKHSGSGIGLSIVKKIIEDHGGYIWATSHEGEGTTMHFVVRKYIEQTNVTEDVTDRSN